MEALEKVNPCSEVGLAKALLASNRYQVFKLKKKKSLEKKPHELSFEHLRDFDHQRWTKELIIRARGFKPQPSYIYKKFFSIDSAVWIMCLTVIGEPARSSCVVNTSYVFFLRRSRRCCAFSVIVCERLWRSISVLEADTCTTFL